MKSTKPVNIRIVERSFDFGASKYLVEKECVFLCFSRWKRDKVLIDSMFGVFDSDREFDSYSQAESYIEQNYNNYELVEPLKEFVDCMW